MNISNNNYNTSPFSNQESSEEPKDDMMLLSAPRKRTRATPQQLAVLEKTFNVNPSPNNRVREQLSRELGMSERSIQIWFQNRRAKVKNIAKKSSMLHDETLRMQYYASSAAAAACQAAIYHQHQQNGTEMVDIGDPIKSNPDLYYYYYYYYFNQQQQAARHYRHPYYHPNSNNTSPTTHSTSSVPPPPISLKSMPPPPPPPPATANSASPVEHKKQVFQQRTRAHTIGSYNYYQQQRKPYDRGNSVDHTRYHNTMPQPNYQDMLNHTNSQQFSHLALEDTSFLPSYGNTPSSSSTANFLHTDTNPSLPWDNLRFYDDPTLMMTPTTPTPQQQQPYSLLQQPFYNTNEIQKISAEALQIGTWKRMGFEPNDLICQFDKQKNNFNWCIQDGVSQFKMEFNIKSITEIQLIPLEGRAGWARLSVKVKSNEIEFFMQALPGNWVQCRDYTEDKQASIINLHQLDGPALALKAELDLLKKENALIESLVV